MRRICSIINTTNGLCSLQRQIFEIIKTCFNILQLQSGNTLPQFASVCSGGRAAGRNEDGYIGVANVNNDVSSGIYSGLPMVLSATVGRQKKSTRRFPPRDINPGNYFCVVHSILRNKGNLHFIRILV